MSHLASSNERFHVADHNGPQNLLRKVRPRILAALRNHPCPPFRGGPRRGGIGLLGAPQRKSPRGSGNGARPCVGRDAGSILTTVRPVVSANDDVASLFAKWVRVGNWFADRTVKAERRVQRLLEDGLLRRHSEGE
jgi:hypothetical protein